MADVLVNATRFRNAHEAEWQQLDELVTRLEKRSPKSLSDDELLALPALYRVTLSSLSIARDTSLDKSLVQYLEQLSTRAYFQIYGVKTPVGRTLLDFFARALPDAMRALWRETLFCVILTVASAVLAFWLVRSDPSWFGSIIPDGLAQGRDPTASAEALRDTLKGDDSSQSMLGLFATFLFTHNAQIALFAFALGFAFAVPTILLILYNGLMLGAILSVFASKGLGGEMAAWLTIHGTTELFAICIAGGAGIRIGTAIAFPGRRSRMTSALMAGRTAATAMMGVIIMLGVAGLLEGVGRQVVEDSAARVAIGLGALIVWLSYFYLGGRRSPTNG